MEGGEGGGRREEGGGGTAGRGDNFIYVAATILAQVLGSSISISDSVSLALAL